LKEEEFSGFKVTFEDGFVQNHYGGLNTIPDDMIRKHGKVTKTKAI